MTRRDSEGTRFLALPGQLLVFILILGPLFGLVLTSIVPGPTGATWRTRSIGAGVDTMIVPVFAIFLGIFLSAHLGHRKLQWTHTVLAFLFGLVFLLAAPIFVLDALELRNTVRAEFKTVYDGGVLRSLLLLLGYGTSLLLLAIMSWRSLRGTWSVRDERSAAAPGLVGTPPSIRPTPPRG